MPRKKTSKYFGVIKNKRNKWKAQIYIKGKVTYLGTFDTENQAADVVNINYLKLGKPAPNVITFNEFDPLKLEKFPDINLLKREFNSDHTYLERSTTKKKKTKHIRIKQEAITKPLKKKKSGMKKRRNHRAISLETSMKEVETATTNTSERQEEIYGIHFHTFDPYRHNLPDVHFNFKKNNPNFKTLEEIFNRRRKPKTNSQTKISKKKIDAPKKIPQKTIDHNINNMNIFPSSAALLESTRNDFFETSGLVSFTSFPSTITTIIVKLSIVLSV